MLGWIAAGGYLTVSGLCLLAAWAALGGTPRKLAAAMWIGMALLFALLAVNRWFAVEDHVRAMLRLWLDAEGDYQARRSIQGPIAAAVLGVGGVAGIALLLGFREPARGRAPRAVAWACRASAVMIGLVALRLVSLHATDALLYAPLHLNWAIDIGSTVLVGACAWVFQASVRQRASAVR